jgi:hypothetical protein
MQGLTIITAPHVNSPMLADFIASFTAARARGQRLVDLKRKHERSVVIARDTISGYAHVRLGDIAIKWLGPTAKDFEPQVLKYQTSTGRTAIAWVTTVAVRSGPQTAWDAVFDISCRIHTNPCRSTC